MNHTLGFDDAEDVVFTVNNRRCKKFTLGELIGGILPVGGTFFVFADYMRPPIRLAALSGAKACFVFTHDSVGVGEDGPTHADPQALQLLQENFPPTTLVTLTPWDPQEVWHLLCDHAGRATSLHITPTTATAWRTACDVTVSETLEASLEMARAALDCVGGTEVEASVILERFKQRYYAGIADVGARKEAERG